MKVSTKIILVFALLTLLINSHYSLAQNPGDLDTTFGNGGIVITHITGYIDGAYSVALQEDGKILLTGYSIQSAADYREMTTVRYLSDGSIDNTFGTDGIVITDVSDREGEAYSIAIQSDGKIIIGGYSESSENNNDDFTLVRYDTSGTLDNTFGTGGIVTTEIRSDNDVLEDLTIQSDGKIVGVGWSSDNPNDDIVVVRYNTDGSLDNSFDGDGIVLTDVASSQDRGRAVALQSDRKILVAGQLVGGNFMVFVARYDTSGNLDTSFGLNGFAGTSIGTGAFATDVAVHNDGKIVICGASDLFNAHHFTLVRFNSDGSLDNTFGTSGIVVTTIASSSAASSIKIDDGGKIIVGGTVLARYNYSGELDSTFGIGGISSTGFGIGYSLAIQSNSKIILGGTAGNDFGLARFIGDVPTELENNIISLNNYNLSQNYPNPFNPSTMIKYQILELSFVTIKVYDVLGNELETLVNEAKSIGSYEVEFDGNKLQSGVYFYRLQAGSFVETKKMILLK